MLLWTLSLVKAFILFLFFLCYIKSLNTYIKEKTLVVLSLTKMLGVASAAASHLRMSSDAVWSRKAPADGDLGHKFT